MTGMTITGVTPKKKVADCSVLYGRLASMLGYIIGTKTVIADAKKTRKICFVTNS